MDEAGSDASEAQDGVRAVVESNCPLVDLDHWLPWNPYPGQEVAEEAGDTDNRTCLGRVEGGVVAGRLKDRSAVHNPVEH